MGGKTTSKLIQNGVASCQVNCSKPMQWHSWILTAKKRILMGMDLTMVWPPEMTRQEKTGSRTEEAIACPAVAGCSFRTDGNSQGTNMSSLASKAIRESNAEKSSQNLINKCVRKQDQINSLAETFENTDD
jgi:hypothetical protein